MRTRGTTLLGIACFSAGCSINPLPPAREGHVWTREELQPGGGRTLETPRGSFTGINNIRTSWDPLFSSFRYQLHLEVVADGFTAVVLCREEDDGSYECDGGGLLTMRLTNNCARGQFRTPGGDGHVELWMQDGVHVGFLMRRGERYLAAFDTDHEWARPVWIESALPAEDRRAFDALAYILNDMLDTESEASIPFLCGELGSLRRHPR